MFQALREFDCEDCRIERHANGYNAITFNHETFCTKHKKWTTLLKEIIYTYPKKNNHTVINLSHYRKKSGMLSMHICFRIVQLQPLGNKMVLVRFNAYDKFEEKWIWILPKKEELK